MSESFDNTSSVTSSKKGKSIGVGIKVECNNDAQKRQLMRALNKLKKIPTGVETLKNLSELGTTVSMAVFGGAYGAYDPVNNRILLNLLYTTDHHLTTLVHEARHAVQYNRLGKDSVYNEYDMNTQVRLNGAMEADAQVFAFQAAKEFEKIGDMGPLKALDKSSPFLLNAYCREKATEDFQDGSDKSKTVLFKSFFDSKKRMASYEDAYINNEILSTFSKSLTNGKVSEEEKKCTLTTAQIASFTCGEYMSNAVSFIDSENVTSLTKKTKNILEIASSALGRDVDVSNFATLKDTIDYKDIGYLNSTPVNDIYKNSTNVLKEATRLQKEEDVSSLYYAPIEEQNETVKNFDADTCKAFKLGKITAKFFDYFRNLSAMSEVRLAVTSKDEERRKTAQNIIENKTKENQELRDYVIVSTFIETHREKNPSLIARVIDLPEISDKVKKELLFDNTVLTKKQIASTASLTEDEEKSLKAMRKGLSSNIMKEEKAKTTAVLTKRLLLNQAGRN
ncbi:MAG: hypothetical protein MJ250_01420 [Alphaproteobacteria bacterium]|nr:hypothetical protein [Alphaproteobacteria bacterium]